MNANDSGKIKLSSSTWFLSLVLIFIEAVSFHLFFPWIGFHIDDWAFIGQMMSSHDQSLLGLIHAMGGTPHLYLRPAEIFYFPLLYKWGGFTAWKYQIALFGIESTAAILIFLAFQRSTGNRSLSFLTALLFLIYPSHEATHFWGTNVWPPAMMFFSAALYCHVLWDETGSLGALLLSVMFLTVGDLIYEAVLPLIIIFPVVSWQGRCCFKRTVWGIRKIFLCNLPVFLTAAILLAYNIVIQRVYATMSRKMAWNGIFFAKVMGKGLECSSTAILDLLRHALLGAFQDWGIGLWMMLPLAIWIFLIWFKEDRGLVAKSNPLETQWWLALEGLAFVCAYLPYAISYDYMPHIFDVQNRVNAAASLPVAMMAALGLSRLAPRRQRIVLTALVTAFTIIHWQSAWEWRQSYKIEEEILSDVRDQSWRIPAGSLVYLEGSPSSVGTAPLFNEDWVFDAALQDDLHRWDLHGSLWYSRRFHRGAARNQSQFVYHYATRQFASLTPLSRAF